MPRVRARPTSIAAPLTLLVALLAGTGCSGDPPGSSAGEATASSSSSSTGEGTATTTAGESTGATTAASTLDTSATSATTSASATTSTSTTAPDPSTSGEPTTTSTGATTSDTTTSDTTTSDTTTGGGLDELLTIEHAQVKGTHNSYHLEPLIPFDASHEYSHVPLAEQAESQGVRAYELDVHLGAGGFEVYHIAVIDSQTTCDTFLGCIGAIAAWSAAHPLHLPIVVWIEVKDQTGGLPIDAGDLDDLDDDIRSVFAADHLFTPDDLQAGHPSPRARLEAEGWPPLAETRGRVIFVLLNVDDDHASHYTGGYLSTAGRAMFARAEPGQFALPWAAIAKLGIGDDAAIDAAHAAHILVATNVCGAGEGDDACFTAAAEAQAAGIHMLKDDFPAKVADMDYFLELEGGSPARCNPITAPPECTSAALEDL